MKNVKKIGVVICFVSMTLLLITSVMGQSKEAEYTSVVKKEVIQKFNQYNGNYNQVTAEKWDSYFLNNPNIGNLHLGDEQVGWEAFHANNIKMESMNVKAMIQFENLEIFPIERNIAWVRGDFIVTIDGEIYNSKFYDSLIKRNGNWYVIMSVVTT